MIDDDRKLKRKFHNKKSNAKKIGIDFLLSYDEFCSLLIEANIKSSDLGPAKYHLSRHNDTGPYKIGNCMFKWYLDNFAERKISDKSVEASKKNISNINENNRILKLRTSLKFQTHLSKRRIAAENNEQIRRSSMHPSFVQEKNSQYGTCWITNGKEVLKIPKEELDSYLLLGYSRGRKINSGP